MRQHELTFSAFSIIEPESIDKGILVWCKWQRYPYWPAVVRTACCGISDVLFGWGGLMGDN